MSDFGPVLRKFRKDAGLSQERLAEAAGVSVEAIKTLESGRRRYPRSATLNLLADGLGLTSEQRAELAAAGDRKQTRVSVPRQLPDDLDDFAGRDQQIAELERVFAAQQSRPGVVVTSAIAGMGGIGKTALGVHVAHRVADRFPDGQLYLNLRGFGPGEPMTVEEALSRLMESLGLQAADELADVGETAARYRSALAGRRVLLLLDNAADAAQVAPLLPGASTCAVLITSRRGLTELPGVAHVTLDVLPDRDAVRMLASVVADGRIAADPASALAIARLCGGVPLALRIAGARLAAEPTWTAADLSDRLDAAHRRLDELSIADLDLRASIELSVAAAADRDPETIAAFRLLGLHDGEELDVEVAAALLDLPVAVTEQILERLVDLHLLDSVAPRRYQLHDLLRSFVQETTAQLVDDAGREAARMRVLRLYRSVAWRVRSFDFLDCLIDDWMDADWVAGAEDRTLAEGLAWLDAEADEIIGAVRRAATAAATKAERVLVGELVAGLLPYFHLRRRYSDGVLLGTIAVVTADAIANPLAAAVLPFELAQQCGAAGHYSWALGYMTTALAALHALDYEMKTLEADVHLGEYLVELGRYDEARVAAERAVAGAVRGEYEITEADGRLILGIIAGRQGRTATQDEEFGRAVELVRRAGTPNARQSVLNTVGSSYLETGRYDEALRYFEECRTTALGAGHEFAVAEALEGLGRIELARGVLDAAEDYLRAALAVLAGTWQPEVGVREHLGRVLAAAGRHEEAAVQWRIALDLLVRHGAPDQETIRALLLTTS
ncbi:helix-turn-helix domain-containing protein [Kribbella sandramycini]|uniref:Helix-turn-helix domain-containing protein n=1 Tax=Kribbella sandramycini TaxID=60450 RepID=A0A7Y4L5F5_9ACTN|nr:XRE family transcriptional regulator [Kribbella sandramycini]MBB6567001.1 tetratricopeptide (TPR) repeat protein [Kribbella sandramycini]NOL44723.1 helix-turn-helix domain-containing protein [Kribbella sandramycini]